MGMRTLDSVEAELLPLKNSHSFGPNKFEKTPLTKCKLYVKRSALNRDLPISEYASFISVLESFYSFCSVLAACGFESRDLLKSLMNEARENWYMLFILSRSPKTMKRLEPVTEKSR